MIRRFKIKKIVWDTDGISPRKLNLPSRFEIDVNLPEGVTYSDGSEGDVVVDAISDKYGWCIKGITYQSV